MSFIRDTFTPSDIQSIDSKRVTWIDLAKGICIILVIMVHVVGGNKLGIVGLQLRVPLYFTLSGLFFKDYGSFKTFLLKKTNKLIVPFVFFYFVSQTVIKLWPADFELIGFQGYLTVFKSDMWFNIALWFLLCLFEVNVIYYVVQRICRAKWLRYCVVFAAGILGAILSKHEINLPIYIDSALTALPIFVFGTTIRQSAIMQESKHATLQAVAGCIAIIGLVVLWKFITPSSIEFRANVISGSYVVALISSCVAVVSLLLICKRIKWLPFFSYIGRYSIVMLCVHILYMFLLRHLGLHDHKLILVGITMLSWLTIPLAIKYIPYFVAQKDLIRVK